MSNAQGETDIGTTKDIKDWHSIITLIVFVITSEQTSYQVRSSDY
jgi:hypothetical protein